MRMATPRCTRGTTSAVGSPSIWRVLLARNAALVEMGLDMAPNQTTRVRVGYQGLLAAHGHDHGLYASVEVRVSKLAVCIRALVMLHGAGR